MTRHFRQISFHGAGDFQGYFVHTAYDGNATPWTCLREEMVRDLDLVEDDLSLIEAYWNDEADGAELVILNGQLIGCINRTLTPYEYEVICATPHFGDVRQQAE